jgi:hypothetical protein
MPAILATQEVEIRRILVGGQPCKLFVRQYLYLRPHEYWSHLIHTIKGLEIGISTFSEYTTLCDEAVIKPTSLPTP